MNTAVNMVFVLDIQPAATVMQTASSEKIAVLILAIYVQMVNYFLCDYSNCKLL